MNEPEGIMLRVTSQSDSERQMLYGLTCKWKLKNKANNKQNKIETDSEIQRTN